MAAEGSLSVEEEGEREEGGSREQDKDCSCKRERARDKEEGGRLSFFLHCGGGEGED